MVKKKLKEDVSDNKIKHQLKNKLDIKGSKAGDYSLSINTYHENNSLWILSGDMIYDTIPANLSQIEKLRPENKKYEKTKKLIPWSIDCRGIKSFDSCGAAYLLSCIRYSKVNKLKLQLIDLPETLHPLLQVQGVAGLFIPLVKNVIY